MILSVDRDYFLEHNHLIFRIAKFCVFMRYELDH